MFLRKIFLIEILLIEIFVTIFPHRFLLLTDVPEEMDTANIPGWRNGWGGSAPTQPGCPQCTQTPSRMEGQCLGSTFGENALQASGSTLAISHEKVLLQGVVLFWCVGVLFAFYYNILE